jgi:hypothetical protein
MLQKKNGCTRVYRRQNERFARNCVLEVNNFSGGSVMMWGAISYAEKLNWCTSTATLEQLDTDEVLTPHMLPAMNLRMEVFQHNNARPHTAHATVDFLANQNVTVLPLLFTLLDLNPIEHLLMTWIDNCAVVNQSRKLCKNRSRLLSKNEGEFCKTVFVD